MLTDLVLRQLEEDAAMGLRIIWEWWVPLSSDKLTLKKMFEWYMSLESLEGQLPATVSASLDSWRPQHMFLMMPAVTRFSSAEHKRDCLSDVKVAP